MNKLAENKIRIKDIAARAGVSPGTVDRVLHNRGEVAENTRKQVMAIVDDLGYTPNLLAKSLASKKLLKIAVLIPDSGQDNPYWEKPHFGIQQAAKEIRDYNTKVHIGTFDFNSEKSFLTAFDALLKENPSGLIFSPVFHKASHQIVRKCNELKLPYMFIDMKLDVTDNLAYFGQDAEQSGFLAAKLLHYSLPEYAEVLIIKPSNKETGNHHLVRREKGFLSFFLSDGNHKEITTQSIELNIHKSEAIKETMDRILKYCNKVAGIFVINSRAYMLAQYLYEQRQKDILLIGYDLIHQNLDFLERGIINFLIGQKPEEQGYKSVQAMFNYLVSGKNIDKTNYSPIDIIMKENIDYYKNYKF